jgi:hypothetical protein
MNKKQIARKNSLLPNGIPRYVRVYDLESVADRYTAVFSKKPICISNGRRWFMYIGMSANPFDPWGIGMHGEEDHLIDSINGKWPPAIGKKNHLGKRINFSDLPPDCQKLVLSDYIELWELE